MVPIPVESFVQTRQSQDAQPPPHEPCVITGFCKKRQEQTVTGCLIND